MGTEMDLKSFHQDSDHCTQSSMGVEVNLWTAAHMGEVVLLQALWQTEAKS